VRQIIIANIDLAPELKKLEPYFYPYLSQYDLEIGPKRKNDIWITFTLDWYKLRSENPAEMAQS